MRRTWLVTLLLGLTACDAIQLGDLLKGSPLARIEPEPAGEHCPLGGRAVHVGSDVDGDGVLDDAEVTSTQYTCDTASADVLVVIEAVGAGEKCARGGQVSRAGRDVNGDKLLDATEVLREVYACAPEIAHPVITQVREGLAPGTNCSGTATLVDAGHDLDGDGQLSVIERRTTLALCFGPASHIVLELYPQEVAPDCPGGGTRIIASLDLNGNGQIDLNEPQGYDYVCDEHHTFDGSYYAHDDVDLGALQGVSHIRGSLIVKHARASLTALDLPALEGIDGDLVIANDDGLTRVSIPRLLAVGGDLDVESNGMLADVALGGAQNLALWVGGSLTLTNNARLEGLDGFAYVAPRKNIFLRANATLAHPEGKPGLPYVTQLSGQLVVANNGKLEQLPLPNLAHVAGPVLIEANDALRSAVGTQLRSVGGDLTLQRNARLESLGGLGKLTSVDGKLTLHSNTALTSMAGLDVLHHVGDLQVSAHPNLAHVGDLEALQVVDGDITFTDNPQARSVRGLSLLTRVGHLDITGHESLASLTGLANLAQARAVTVSATRVLTTLSDLEALKDVGSLTLERNAELGQVDLPALENVTEDFIVRDNPRLATCQANQVANLVFKGPEKARVIEGNNDAASCP
ncbi:hypothetical protein LY474_23120 [Myxococcus stipitatus]|uniref:DUF7151 family protein n=1 Tax=Myxococcus stipitatus TaxID=83455 RepID=UPI001F186183|nr:hypothetical protein [Myxococcus stipitatus]MCE9670703.1 hypothetical protein [Myxococcus stipitatus]